MFNKLKEFFLYIKAYKDFENTMMMFGRKTLFELERFIQVEDKKRKQKMSDDKIAKEILLYDDCYIIPKKEINEYITKR